MPGKGTPRQAIRIPDELWRRLGEAATTAGSDRATVVRALIRWYIRDEGAKLPQRP